MITSYSVSFEVKLARMIKKTLYRRHVKINLILRDKLEMGILV